MGPTATAGLWGVLCVGMIVFAAVAQFGIGARAFVGAFAAFALLFGAMLLFASRGIVDRVAAAGPGAGWLLGVALFLVYILYSVGTGTLNFLRLGEVALFLFGPLAILASARGAAAGTWQDFLVIAGIWIAVKFGPSCSIWPYPEGKFSYILTVLLAVNIAIAGFLVLRRAKGAGYTIGWGQRWTFFVLASFATFALVAIWLGFRLHFIAFDPQWHRWKTEPALALGILFFTAWPEEFLFRGLLQNFLTRASNNDWAGWIGASVLFGLSHITNGGFPNWRYAILASIAGLFYGWTWRKTGSIFASALVHAAVDVFWHFLFRTL
ncbi:MAG TPA: type II CAAX endopeptidase family protein [Candidatus Acidoferrum sp.]|nr:type II CAAX endopeptidase family protein [Candidatus Acidoferrum sp.]